MSLGRSRGDALPDGPARSTQDLCGLPAGRTGLGLRGTRSGGGGPRRRHGTAGLSGPTLRWFRVVKETGRTAYRAVLVRCEGLRVNWG